MTVTACGSSSSHANKLSKADELGQQLQAAGGARAYDAEMAPERDARRGVQTNGKQLAEITPARDAECKRTVRSLPKLRLSATRSASARCAACRNVRRTVSGTSARCCGNHAAGGARADGKQLLPTLRLSATRDAECSANGVQLMRGELKAERETDA